MKNKNIVITDNFLDHDEFVKIRDNITVFDFPWFFNPVKVDNEDEDQSLTPGQFVHTIYKMNLAVSQFYDHHVPIMHKLNIAILSRIKLNLNPRLPEPFYSDFHIDDPSMQEEVHFITSIFYINTNNGYTEFEDGTKVESVANRLASFPANIKHRGVTQTDTQCRIVINYNYLKRSDA